MDYNVLCLLAAPGPPRNIQILVLSSRTAVFVSWLPPDPPNGILLQYLARILTVSTSHIASSQVLTIGSTTEEQGMARSITFEGLDLDNFRYQIEVYASTSVGQGPSSIPVFVGMDSGNVIITTGADRVTTDAEQPRDTTSSAPVLQTTISTGQPIVTQTVLITTSLLPTTSGMPPTVGETLPSPVLDDEYYIVRIVPPVVVILFILVIFVAIVMGFCCRSRMHRESRKGIYTVDASRDYAMK